MTNVINDEIKKKESNREKNGIKVGWRERARFSKGEEISTLNKERLSKGADWKKKEKREKRKKI